MTAFPTRVEGTTRKLRRRDRAELLGRSNEIMGWLQSGQLKVSVDTSFPLAQAADGHKYLESGASTGKVLYEI